MIRAGTDQDEPVENRITGPERAQNGIARRTGSSRAGPHAPAQRL